MREWLVSSILNAHTLGQRGLWKEADGGADAEAYRGLRALSGGNDRFLATLFKLLEGPVGRCSNARLLQVFGRLIFLCPCAITPRKQLTWDVGAVHTNHMACPTKLGPYNHADKACSVQDYKVSHSVLPSDAHA